LTLTGPDRERDGLEAARAVFLEGHRADGHGPCDARTAFLARLYQQAGSNVDPLASAQSPEKLAVRYDAGRHVEPKPAAE